MGRRPNNLEAEKWILPYENASLSASLTVKHYKVPTGRTLRLDRASYINPTGLTGDNANDFSLEVKNGATQACLVFNTDLNDATPGASLPVNTFVEGTLSATDSARVFQAGDIVSLVFTLEGTQTLPVGHLVLEGRLF